MDMRKYAVAPTSVLHLRDADDNLMYDDSGKGQPGDAEYQPGKPITVTLYGPGSKQFARAQAANSNKMVDRLKRKGKTDQTAEQKTAETADFLCAVTKEFSPNFQLGELQGEALIRAAYSELEIGFIPEQVNKYLNDWGNFSKGSTSTSPSTPAN